MTKPPVREIRGIISALLDQPYLLLVLAPLFWGGNGVAAKLVIGEIPPFLFLATRCVGATAIMLPFAWPHLKRDWPTLRRAWPLLMAFGAIGYALFNVFLYKGLETTTVANSSIEQAAMPMLILGANFVLFRVRAHWLQIVGVIIAITGVIVTATHGDPLRILRLDINIGDGYVILACLCYTAYTLALKFRPDVHLMSFLGVAFLGAALTGLVMLALFGGLGQFGALTHASPMAWTCIAYVMVFPSIFSQICYARGVELVGPNRAAPSHNLIPVFGTLGSVLILGETLQPYHYISAAIIIGGIVLAEFSARRLAR